MENRQENDKAKYPTYGENISIELIIGALFVGSFLFGATVKPDDIFTNYIFLWFAFVIGMLFVELFVVFSVKTIAHSIKKWIDYSKDGKNKAMDIFVIIFIFALTIIVGLILAIIAGVWGKFNLEAIIGGY